MTLQETDPVTHHRGGSAKPKLGQGSRGWWSGGIVLCGGQSKGVDSGP